jgi:hypothetical protein
MNIFSKTLFTLSFLIFITSGTKLSAMKTKTERDEIISNKIDGMLIRTLKQPAPRQHYVEYPGWYKFSWREFEHPKKLGKSINNRKLEIYWKTKALLGTLITGSIIGTGYYFNWFRKK